MPYHSNMTMTSIGEEEKTLPLIHETKDTTKIVPEDCVEGSIIISDGAEKVNVNFFYETGNKTFCVDDIRKYAGFAVELEPYASALNALGDDKAIVDIIVSPFADVNIH